VANNIASFKIGVHGVPLGRVVIYFGDADHITVEYQKRGRGLFNETATCGRSPSLPLRPYKALFGGACRKYPSQLTSPYTIMCRSGLGGSISGDTRSARGVFRCRVNSS
jgi:hypothetical protein